MDLPNPGIKPTSSALAGRFFTIEPLGNPLSSLDGSNWRRKWQPTPVFLPGESQGRGSLVGCRLWGRTESDTTEVTAAAAAADDSNTKLTLKRATTLSGLPWWHNFKESAYR